MKNMTIKYKERGNFYELEKDRNEIFGRYNGSWTGFYRNFCGNGGKESARRDTTGRVDGGMEPDHGIGRQLSGRE